MHVYVNALECEAPIWVLSYQQLNFFARLL